MISCWHRGMRSEVGVESENSDVVVVPDNAHLRAYLESPDGLGKYQLVSVCFHGLLERCVER